MITENNTIKGNITTYTLQESYLVTIIQFRCSVPKDIAGNSTP